MTKEMLDQKYRGVKIRENDRLLHRLDGADGTMNERHFEFSEEVVPGGIVKGEVWIRTDAEGRWSSVDFGVAKAWNQETEDWEDVDNESAFNMFDAIMQEVVVEENGNGEKERKIREIFNSFGFSKSMFGALNQKVSEKTGCRLDCAMEYTFIVIKRMIDEADRKIYSPYIAILDRKRQLLALTPSEERGRQIECLRKESVQYETYFGMPANEFIARFAELKNLLLENAKGK